MGSKVEGVDINPFAFEMAMKNAELNNISAEFRAGDASTVSFSGFDTLIVDPPRKGLKETAKLLAKSNVENIVYVSCNPKAFVRDFEHLKSKYRIEDAL